MNYEQEKAVAIAAVRQAAQLCEAVRQDMVPAAIEKSDKNPVTVADFGAQALVDLPQVGFEEGDDQAKGDVAAQVGDDRPERLSSLGFSRSPCSSAFWPKL